MSEGGSVRFVVEQKHLDAALARVRPAVRSPGGDLRALSHILIEADGDSLRLTATNLEMTIRCQVPASVQVPGAALVPARLADELIDSFPSGPVTADMDGSALVLSSGPYRCKLVTIRTEEFPRLSPVAGVEVLVDAAELRAAILGVEYAAADDLARPVLRAIHMEALPGAIKLAAADGYRLAEASLPVDGSVDRLSANVPAAAMRAVASMLRGEGGTVALRISQERVEFRTSAGEIAAQTIEGDYPNYAAVLPTTWKSRAVVSCEELVDALRVVSLFADTGYKRMAPAVRLEFEPGSVRVSASDAEKGTAQCLVACDLQGEPIAVAVNARFIAEAIRAVAADRVAIELTAPHAPIAVRPSEGSGPLALVMPLAPWASP